MQKGILHCSGGLWILGRVYSQRGLGLKGGAKIFELSVSNETCRLHAHQDLINLNGCGRENGLSKKLVMIGVG